MHRRPTRKLIFLPNYAWHVAKPLCRISCAHLPDPCLLNQVCFTPRLFFCVRPVVSCVSCMVMTVFANAVPTVLRVSGNAFYDPSYGIYTAQRANGFSDNMLIYRYAHMHSIAFLMHFSTHHFVLPVVVQKVCIAITVCFVFSECMVFIEISFRSHESKSLASVSRCGRQWQVFATHSWLIILSFNCLHFVVSLTSFVYTSVATVAATFAQEELVYWQDQNNLFAGHIGVRAGMNVRDVR